VRRDSPRICLALAACLIVLLLPEPAHGAESSAPCLRGDAAWIYGVPLGASPEDTVRLLGEPVRREIGGGEDDGGPYEEIRLAYPRLDVFLVRGVVDRVTTTHRASCTGGGICPGMNRDHVVELLAGVRLVDHSPSSVSVYLCEEDHFLSDYYLIVEFTAEGKVARLELVLDRP
jgi:hypothetical protein